MKVRLGVNGPALPPREAARSPDRQLMAGYAAAGGGGPITFKSHTLDDADGREADVRPDEADEGQPAALGRGVQRLLRRVRAVRRPEEGREGDGRRPRVRRPSRTPRTGRRSSRCRPPTSSCRPPAVTGGDGRLGRADGPLRPPLAAGAQRRPLRRRPAAVRPDARSSPAGRARSARSAGSSTCWSGCSTGSTGWPAGSPAAGDWGLAIILLVALVRTLLHPITKRSQMQMMKMGKMGPAMAEAQEEVRRRQGSASAKAQMEL